MKRTSSNESLLQIKEDESSHSTLSAAFFDSSVYSSIYPEIIQILVLFERLLQQEAAFEGYDPNEIVKLYISYMAEIQDILANAISRQREPVSSANKNLAFYTAPFDKDDHDEQESVSSNAPYLNFPQQS